MRNTSQEGNNFGGIPPKNVFRNSCGVFFPFYLNFKKGHQTVGFGPIRAGKRFNGHIQSTVKIGKP